VVENPWWWLLIVAAPLAYWLAAPGIRPAILAVISVAFLLAYNTGFVAILLAWAVFAWLAVRAAKRTPVVITGTLLLLATFKYVPELGLTPPAAIGALGLLLPLGLSYFCFKLLHYTVEMRRGNIAAHSTADFFGYLFLVPIFTAGPIERFDHFLVNRAASWETAHLVEGGTRILHGLIKKFVIGWLILELMQQAGIHNVMTVADHVNRFSVAQVWAMLFCLFLLIYMDFSAYSDIAIGASRLFGIRIMENFNFPILASNFGDLWRRWHMTLVAFCQAYIYMPVLGWTRNPYLATTASFIVVGLWHAGSWNWLAWGLFNAAGVIAFRAWGRRRRNRRPSTTMAAVAGEIAGRTLTLAFFALGTAFAATYPQGDLLDALRLIARALLIPVGPADDTMLDNPLGDELLDG
jgi:alginate O-acetyltransferase complex protein AlgI